MRRGTCHAMACSAAATNAAFCDRHWLMLESDTQRVIARTYRDVKRESAAFFRALAQAQSEILFYVTNGHRMPRASAFEFDDEGKAITHE